MPSDPTHAFTFRASGRPNKIVTEIRISLPTKGNTGPSSVFDVTALWDTGATGSVITPSAAKKLKLIPIGSTPVLGAGSQFTANVHLVDIYLSDKLRVQALPVTEAKKNNPVFEFIIGMDIITTGDFAISQDGPEWVVSFRYPSRSTFDFVKELDAENRALTKGLVQMRKTKFRPPDMHRQS